MHGRLSFYVRRDSAIHHLNPLTKVVLALSIILVAFIAPWDWTATILFFLVIVPLCFAGKVSREFFRSAVRLIIPASGFIFIMQAFFQPVDRKSVV